MQVFNLDQPTHKPEWLDPAARTAVFKPDGIAITSDFPCGNGRHFQRTGAREYKFRARAGRQPFTYRFFFRIDQTGANPGRPLRFRVTDFKMSDPPVHGRDLAAMISYDQHEWRALPSGDIRTLPDICEAESDYRDSKRAYSVEYVFTPNRFPVWFASPLPFTAPDFQELLEHMARQPGWEAASLGRNAYRQDIPIIRYQGAPNPAHALFFTAGQHPSEIGGILGLRGALDAFLDLPEATRAQFAVHAVPVVCMDGWLFGRSVHNAADEVGVNLNRDWSDFNAPETRAVKNALFTARPDVFVDFHNGRGDTVCRLQEYGLTPASRRFWEEASREFVSPQGPPVLKDRDLPGMCVPELLRNGWAQSAVTFENMLTVNPSRETYLANGRALLVAVVKTVLKE